MNGERYAVCIGCREEWNVSVYAKIGNDGYICSKCEALINRGIPLVVVQARAKNKNKKQRRIYGKF